MDTNREWEQQLLFDEILHKLHRKNADASYALSFAVLATYCLRDLDIPITTDFGRIADRTTIILLDAMFEALIKKPILAFSKNKHEQRMLTMRLAVKLLQPYEYKLMHEYLIDSLAPQRPV